MSCHGCCCCAVRCHPRVAVGESWTISHRDTNGGDNQRVGCMLTDSLCARSELLAHCLKDPLLLIMIFVSRLFTFCAFHFLPFLHHSLHRFFLTFSWPCSLTFVRFLAAALVQGPHQIDIGGSCVLIVRQQSLG